MSAGDSGPMSGQESPALRLCARCGGEFQCGAAAGSCWLTGFSPRIPLVLPIPCKLRGMAGVEAGQEGPSF